MIAKTVYLVFGSPRLDQQKALKTLSFQGFFFVYSDFIFAILLRIFQALWLFLQIFHLFLKNQIVALCRIEEGGMRN